MNPLGSGYNSSLFFAESRFDRCGSPHTNSAESRILFGSVTKDEVELEYKRKTNAILMAVAKVA